MKSVRRPSVKLFDQETVNVIMIKGYDLLKQVGVRIGSQEALQILGDHGASVDLTKMIDTSKKIHGL